MKVVLYVYCGSEEDRVVSLNKEDLLDAVIAESWSLDFESWFKQYVDDNVEDFLYSLRTTPSNLFKEMESLWRKDLIAELNEKLDCDYNCEFFSYELDIPLTCESCPNNMPSLEDIVKELGGLETLFKKMGGCF